MAYIDGADQPPTDRIAKRPGRRSPDQQVHKEKWMKGPREVRKEKLASSHDYRRTAAHAAGEREIPSGTIEVTFPNGAQIWISPPIDYDVLSQVFAAAKSAVKQK